MGKYDDILAGLPESTGQNSPGKYDDILAGLPEEKQSLSPMQAFSVAQDLAPWNFVRRHTLDPLGEKTTEAIGGAGYPKTGAAVGTAIQIAPELVSLADGLGAAYSSKNPSIVGRLNSTRELGPQYDAQNAAIGVSRRVPPEGGMTPRYSAPERIVPTKQPRPIAPAEPIPSNIPVRYPSKPGDFMAYANGRLSGSKPIDPQELMDWQVKLQTDLNNGVIPKIDQTTGRTTTIYQQAVDLLDRTKNTFNKIAQDKIQNTELPENVIPSREGLNKAFGIAASREKSGKIIGKVAKGAAVGVIPGYGLYQALKRLTGGQP